MSNIRYMYVRDAKWEPIGCVAISLDRSKNRARYGLSMRHPKDALNSKGRRVRFDRSQAQELALNNMVCERKTAYITSEANMHEVTAAVCKDIIARGSASTSAIKFAKRWLSVNELVYMNNASTFYPFD